MNDASSANAASMGPALIEALAERVDSAQRHARTMAKLTLDYPALDMVAAYAVQDALRARMIARGDRLVGYKCGLTSKAKMIQMGVDEPGYGFLTAAMQCTDDEVIRLGELIHPRVEAEVAFFMKHELFGRECGIDEVMAATDSVAAALEIIDSRFEAFKFDLPSVMADNASSARFVVSARRHDPRSLDLAALKVVLENNGAVLASAPAAAVMGHPALAVAALVRHLSARGETLAAGSIVMSGGVTEAFAAASGDIMRARIDALGSVAIRFE